ncbi:TPR repeat-containing thioredoxin TDX-like [Salvia miltiorrhiza]|uniref:TPR repeat-containing thioredoxin TDX-like n=1 Tax=Salvia miltiorrhiza TaxID=226208 RepID=UPI0025ABAD71|nr:TPR repeat-containing thioredoxin TDX-like [Salvia miltiorrhiza]
MLRSTYLKTVESNIDRALLYDSLEVEIVESDLELDNSDVVEPDYDSPPEMGDPSVEVTEEAREAALVQKSMAMDAILEGNLDKAIILLTEAIILNPKSSMLYASRASVFVKLKKPNAATRDADAALKINDELGKGYKARGMAKVMLGLWEDAARDLHMASKLDFDEEATVMLKKVESNVKKIVEHRQKYEKLHKAKEQRKAELERLRKMQEAQNEFGSFLKDGQVIPVESAKDLKMRLNAASKMSRLAIVYFTAAWCGPCVHIGPIYTKLASKYPKAVFLKVDIDEVREAAAEWRIPSIPSFYLSKDGSVVDEELQISMNSLEKKILEHTA